MAPELTTWENEGGLCVDTDDDPYIKCHGCSLLIPHLNFNHFLWDAMTKCNASSTKKKT